MKYTIRPCQSLEELAKCVSLQQQIWGYADAEVYPLRLFVTLTKIGGNVLGAFSPEGRQVGFVASMPAWHGAQRYYHSLSLGVAVGHENRGLGRALKLAQREEAIRQGIASIEWTFDPLKAKNAFFNIERLGAIIRRYSPDHYGVVESRLQQGLPSDRLLAEWWLESPRVLRALQGEHARSHLRRPAAQVEFPADIGHLAETFPARAREIQLAVRERLQAYFAEGLAIIGFARGEKANSYLLDRQPESEIPNGSSSN